MSSLIYHGSQYPWQGNFDPDTKTFEVFGTIIGSKYKICTIDYNPFLGITPELEKHYYDEAAYNTLVCAAAPQLLEALQTMLATFEYDGQTEGENQACSKARRAIQKALTK